MYRESPDLPVTETKHPSPYHELAEAIRRGIKIKPRKCCGVSYRYDDAACALGAAASGGFRTETIPEHIRAEIIMRNDRLYQSRERIADWLDTAFVDAR